MKKWFVILPEFLVSPRMVCAFLVLALILGSMTGCKPTEDITVSSPPAPSMEPTEQPSADLAPKLSEPPAPSVPASDVISLPPSQPTAQPSAQSAPPSNPPAQTAFPEIVLSERSLNIPSLTFWIKTSSFYTVRRLKSISACLAETPAGCVWGMRTNSRIWRKPWSAMGFLIPRPPGGMLFGQTLMV